jgi:CheY-like chemotaxis protein
MLLDHYRFTQIFLNLIGNAIKYTDKGSVEVTIEWIPGKQLVDEECFQPYPFNDSDDLDEGMFEKSQLFGVFEKDLVNLSLKTTRIPSHLLKEPISTKPGVMKVIVKDTGSGMPSNKMSQLFQKFSQITNDASKKKLGTGLGLFITKQIVKRMNGEIKVYSREGQGSSFIFCIPVVCGQQEEHHLHDIDSLKDLICSKNLKAMIVDDISFNHIILKNFMTKIKIGISEIATNGLEAVKKYERLAESWSRPEIITMDLDMPIMDGKQASRKIRQFEREKGLTPCFLIIISGNCSSSEIKECMDENGTIKAQAFIKKPVNIEDLIRVIGGGLGKLKGH